MKPKAKSQKQKVKIVFLDRDGVVNEDSAEYIKEPSEFHFIPRSPEAVALLNRHGFEVILITNQSLIGRKMADLQTLEAIFHKMKKGIQGAGGRIRDIFFCPHTPDQGCSCRKPRPGLILKAAEVYGIDPAGAVMVGDSAKDVECGINAGCGLTCLVATGNGRNARKDLARKGIVPDYFGEDLYDAAQWITNHPIGSNE
ncbi:D-glycero-beta-D-manno-heptose 1,7-bisphosphate 7-phosphatase [Desulfospira joergensenii]|uniref:D-glycero-beta-D-manno-heptose 1,7-bisphosphate 7-phosphatase n=1 Tax=Desulfospira joergensenii TaxID=53329 RepID=UPI0003B49745|nr:D-glycero-beta-D-manno-heptose 1,7-bisphosphate 7-phosphatase [Desulfospira joergensenii]